MQVSLGRENTVVRNPKGERVKKGDQETNALVTISVSNGGGTVFCFPLDFILRGRKREKTGLNQSAT